MSADCIAAVVASVAGSSAGADEVLISGFDACAAAAVDCLRTSLSANGGAHTGAAAAAVSCGLLRAAEAPASGCELEEPFMLLARLATRACALVASYGTVQFVLMPWFFLWIFSSSVLGWVHFLRMQWHIVRMGVDFLWMVVLYILIVVEEFFSACVSCVRAWVSTSYHNQQQLEGHLQTAATLEEHLAAERALAKFLSREDVCCTRRRGAEKVGDDHDAWVESMLQRATGSVATLATLEPLLLRHVGGVDWAHVPHGGEYLHSVSRCLTAVTQRMEKSSRSELLSWLQARQKALGCTALCLSGGGTLAMYHLGFCRFLLQKEIMPKVISGVSGGSIVAAFLAMHTDVELLDHVFVPDLICRHGPELRWFPPFLSEVINFLRLGVLVPTEDFERTCQAFFGKWTFEEAFARTGRQVSIVISSNFSRKLPACVMLNHVTTPRVTLASAVATSCAAMGIMRPRGLACKNPATGELVPFNLLGKSFADGTFTAEVPKDYLRSAFGVNQFLVSQVNPHVSSFLGAKGSGMLVTLRSYFGRDLQVRARLLSESHLLPSFFGRTMCNATKHLSQDFQESSTGLTVFPHGMGLGSIKAAVSNPSIADMNIYILEGQRMAWRKADEIQARMHTEAALAAAVERVEGRRATSPYDSNQPPALST